MQFETSWLHVDFECCILSKTSRLYIVASIPNVDIVFKRKNFLLNRCTNSLSTLCLSSGKTTPFKTLLHSSTHMGVNHQTNDGWIPTLCRLLLWQLSLRVIVNVSLPVTSHNICCEKGPLVSPACNWSSFNDYCGLNVIYLLIQRTNCTSEDIHSVIQFIIGNLHICLCCLYLCLPHPHPSVFLQALYCKKKKNTETFVFAAHVNLFIFH